MVSARQDGRRRRSEIRAFVLQADNQIISRLGAISMLSVDAVLVLANPSGGWNGEP